MSLQAPFQSEVTDQMAIKLVWKVVQKMRQRGDDMTVQCLFNQEKLIHLTMIALNKKSISQSPFDLQQQIINFIQKINRVTMENFKQSSQNIDVKIFSKAVDVLMMPNLGKFIKDLKVLGKIKVLTFNNLACIYKNKKKFGIALRAVSFALEIEEALLKDQLSEQKYDIIPTYLNKAAILSQMGKHDKAIEEILKSKKYIQKIQKQVVKQISEAEQTNEQSLKKRLQEKRYYGLYMKMLINYNMGAQKQHMKLLDSAKDYYRSGRQLAVMINNPFMIKKFQGILSKMA